MIKNWHDYKAQQIAKAVAVGGAFGLNRRITRGAEKVIKSIEKDGEIKDIKWGNTEIIKELMKEVLKDNLTLAEKKAKIEYAHDLSRDYKKWGNLATDKRTIKIQNIIFLMFKALEFGDIFEHNACLKCTEKYNETRCGDYKKGCILD
jgi:hypothetical protein